MNIEALFKINYGVYVISSINKDSHLNGQIANAVMQVTAEPKQIAIAINTKNLTYEYIKESKVFSIAILEEDTDMQFIGTFGFKSGRDIAKFENTNYKIGKTGVPIILDYSIAFIECKVVNSMNIGTHTIFIGEVIDSDTLKVAEPMTYAYYHKVKRGKSPKNAPTYKGKLEVKEKTKEENKMQKYVCTICGYVYDPELGDSDSDIAAGTSFEDIPEDWVCPVCGVGKDDFEKE